MSIEGHRQGHFLTLFFQVLYILCLYEAQISGERLQGHWSSGYVVKLGFTGVYNFYFCSETYVEEEEEEEEEEEVNYPRNR